MDSNTNQSVGKTNQSRPTLNRETFRTSREMDFFSEKELTTQTSHGVEDWPLVFLKETIDNALDACEGANTAPAINVVADAEGISDGSYRFPYRPRDDVSTPSAD